jgi:ABC-2 type transport system ATP-binding protein
VQTSSPTATVTELASEFGGEIPGLTVTRPTLEDIYLELIAATCPAKDTQQETQP